MQNPDKYTRRPPNDPTLGLRYENANILLAFLTLSDGQAVAREIEQPDKFDDVVIRATDGQQRYEYYYRQLKHKQSDSKSITWDDLLAPNKGPFALKAYFESFMKVDRNKINVKELSIATNTGLVAVQYQTLTSAAILQRKYSKCQPRPITSADANHYFEIIIPDEKIWKPVTRGNGKRYRFSWQGVKEMKAIMSSYGAQRDVEDFLDLLVFDVDQPNLEELEKINRLILKLYFPFLNDEAHDDFYRKSKERILHLVEQAPQTAGQQTGQTFLAEWAAVSKRCSLFSDIVNNEYKAKVTLGSVPGYEVHTLNRLYTQLQFNQIDKGKLVEKSKWFPAWEQFLKTTSVWNDATPIRVQNLITQHSTTLTALKLYKLLDDSKLLDRSLFVRVDDKEGAESIREQCVKLDDELYKFGSMSPKRISFIIETLSVDELKRIFFSFLINVTHLRKWILFVVISRDAIEACDVVEDDSPLEWNDLSVNTRTMLANKTLRIDANLTTSLTELGLGEKELSQSITPNTLVDLALHDEMSPLPFPLNSYDVELDDFYITRRVRLPGIELNDAIRNGIGNRLTLSETEYNERAYSAGSNEDIYLLSACQEVNRVSYSSNNTNRFNGHCNYLWSRSNFRGKASNVGYTVAKKISLGERTGEHSINGHSQENNEVALSPNASASFDQDLEDATVDGETYASPSKRRKIASSSQNVEESTARIDRSDYPWSAQNRQRSFDEMKKFVTSSRYSPFEVDEKYLLNDEVNFGSGCDGRLAIVVDYAGKGKTTLLDSFSNYFLKESTQQMKGKLLLCVSLKEYTKYTDRNVQTGEEAMDLLVDMLFKSIEKAPSNKAAAPCTGDNLAKHIIRNMCLNSKESRVILMYDGFDEISNLGRERVSQMIEKLLEGRPGIKRIILTSRPDKDLTEVLENRFKRFVLHLRDFNRADQIEFMTKKWKKAMPNEDEGRIVKFAEHLVDAVDENIPDEDHNSVLGIPLQCLIFSECFQEKLQDHLVTQRTSKAGDEKLPVFDSESFKLLRLYENFFERKLKILFQEKSNFLIDPSNDADNLLFQLCRITSLDSLKRLAVFHMMENEGEAGNLARISWAAYSSDQRGKHLQAANYRRDIETVTKLGFLRTIPLQDVMAPDRTRLKFIHRTFAEYFLALYLHDQLISKSSDLFNDEVDMIRIEQQSTFKIITNKILYAREYAGTRRFFDRMLQESLPPMDARELLCPLAERKREIVIKEFPQISHARFNEFLMQQLKESVEANGRNPSTAEVHEDNLVSDELNEVVASSHEENCVKNMIDVGAYFRESDDETTSILSWLLLCVKERMISKSCTIDLESIAEKVTASMGHELNEILESDNEDLMEEQWMPRYDSNFTKILHWCATPVDLKHEKRIALSSAFLKVFTVIFEIEYFEYRCPGPTEVLARISTLLVDSARHHVYDAELKAKVIEKIFQLFERIPFYLVELRAEYYLEGAYIFLDTPRNNQYIEKMLSLSNDFDLLMTEQEFVKRLFELFTRTIESANLSLEFRSETLLLNTDVLFTTSNYLLEKLKKLEMHGEACELFNLSVGYIVKLYPLIEKALISLRDYHNVDEETYKFFNGYILSSRVLILSEKDEEKRNAAVLAMFYTPSGRRLIGNICEENCWSPGEKAIFEKIEQFPDYKERQHQIRDWMKEVLVIIQQTQGELKFVNFLNKMHRRVYSSDVIRFCIKRLLQKQNRDQPKQSSKWLNKALRALYKSALEKEKESEFIECLIDLFHQAPDSPPVRTCIRQLKFEMLTEYYKKLHPNSVQRGIIQREIEQRNFELFPLIVLIFREKDEAQRRAALKSMFFTDSGRRFIIRFCKATSWNPSYEYVLEMFNRFSQNSNGQETRQQFTNWLEQALIYTIQETEGEQSIVEFLDTIPRAAYSSHVILHCIEKLFQKTTMLRSTSLWLNKALEAIWMTAAKVKKEREFAKFLERLPLHVKFHSTDIKLNHGHQTFNDILDYYYRLDFSSKTEFDRGELKLCELIDYNICGQVFEEKDEKKRNDMIVSTFYTEQGRECIERYCRATSWKPRYSIVREMFKKRPKYICLQYNFTPDISPNSAEHYLGSGYLDTERDARGLSDSSFDSRGSQTGYWEYELRDWMYGVLKVIEETQGERGLVGFLDAMSPEAYSSYLILFFIEAMMWKREIPEQTSRWLEKALKALRTTALETKALTEFKRFLCWLKRRLRREALEKFRIPAYIEELRSPTLVGYFVDKDESDNDDSDDESDSENLSSSGEEPTDKSSED